MLFIALWLLVFVIGIKIWRLEAFQPDIIWPFLGPDKNVKIRVFKKRLNCIIFGFTPGWFVKTVTFEKAVNQLPLPGLNVSNVEFYSFKQFLWTLSGSIFLLWCWFGDFNFQNFIQFGFICLLMVLLPELYLLKTIKLYEKKLEREVPYFLDMLTLSLQSGGNLEQALWATTKNYQGRLSSVVRAKLKELNWGRPLESLLIELKFEIKDIDFNHFIDSILRAKKRGVSLSETLVIQARILRTSRRQKAEELSRTASVKISLPLVLFIFPALLIIYIGPGILQLLERT
jgi:Flp pilus assembly protein TadB